MGQCNNLEIIGLLNEVEINFDVPYLLMEEKVDSNFDSTGAIGM